MDLPSRIHCLRLEVQLSNKNYKEKSHKKDTTQAGAIIHKLRRAEVLLGQGKKTEEACRELGILDATYYKWRREYGGHGRELGEAFEASGSGECAPEAPGCGYGIGHPCSEGRSGGKLPSAERKRRCVATVRQRHGLSERRACAAPWRFAFCSAL